MSAGKWFLLAIVAANALASLYHAFGDDFARAAYCMTVAIFAVVCGTLEDRR